MIKLLGYVLTLTIIIAFTQGCTSNDNTPQNTDVISAGAMINSIHVKSHWSTPTTLAEMTSNEYFDSGDIRNISLMTDTTNGFFASWEMPNKQTQFAMRPSIGTPWTITGPDIVGFNTVLSPKLYANPQSTAVFATWSSPDHKFNTHYISRYTPDIGWTTSLAFSDVTPRAYPWLNDSKVIAGTNADAVLLWYTYAANGTMELHARRFDTQGNLSLTNTLIIGQPGRLVTGLETISAKITSTGDLDLYWVDNDAVFNDSLGMELTTLQLWQSTYSLSNSGVATWSTPQKIQPGRFQFTNIDVNHIDVILNNDDTTIIFHSIGLDTKPIRILESTAGVWEEITSVTPNPISNIVGSAAAFNAQGQTVLAWSEIIRSGTAPDDNTQDIRVFAAQYNIDTGWTPPQQINNASPRTIPNSEIGPRNGSTIIINRISGPKVDINAAGKITVAWHSPLDPTLNLYTNHYDPATGWQGEELAITTAFLPIFNPTFKLALANNGDASILWPEIEHSTSKITVRIRSITHAGTENSVNSAWDEPTEIDIVTSPINNRSIDSLHLIANEQGEATVYFSAKSVSDMPRANPVAYVWGGDVLSGGWLSESPLLATAAPETTAIHDMEIDPLTGDLHMAWSIDCPDRRCVDLYVSRKPTGETWEAPISVAKNAEKGINLLVNSTSIGAVWPASVDSAFNPEIAYAEYQQTTGWSAPDLFASAAKPSAVGLLSHSLSWPLSVMNENGVVSILIVTFPQNTPTITLLQRHPVNGWMKMATPININTDLSTVNLSATGTDDAVHLVVTEGLDTDDIRLTSFQLANGSWDSPYEVDAPQQGKIYLGPGPISQADSNNKGEVIVGWHELVGSDFSATLQVRVNRYDPNVGWSQPIDIGFAIPRANDRQTNAINFMQASINESGQGAVIWVETLSDQQTLNLIHLDPTMSIINHEKVRLLDPKKARFDAIELHLDNQGRAILVWDEMTESPTEATHRIMTTTHHPEGTISPPKPTPPPEMTPPPLLELPKPSPNWSEAKMVWEFPQAVNLLQPPEVTAVGDNPTMAIQVDHQFDPLNNRFTSSDHILVSSNTQGEWNKQNPFGNNLPSVMTHVQLASDENTKTVFALWSSQQQLYINHRINNGTWGSPQRIASNAEAGHLLSNTPGQVVIVWQPIDDSATVLVSEISIDATGAINLTPGDPSTKAAATLASDPVFNHQGILAILRAVPAATDQEYVVTQYEIGSGWQAWPDQTLNANDFYPPSLQLTITSDNQMIAFAQSTPLRTLHSATLQSDGTWTNWIAIQPSSDTPVALTGQYRMGTSTNGQLYVMWVEEVIDDQGEPINQVMFSSFDAAGLATGNPWQVPTLITQIRHPNYHEIPQLLVSRDGAAAIVWEQTATIQIDGRPTEVNSILVKKYDPNTGWNSDSDIAAAFPLLFLDQPTSVSTHLSESGQLFIVWKTLGNSFLNIPPTISMTRGQF